MALNFGGVATQETYLGWRTNVGVVNLSSNGYFFSLDFDHKGDPEKANKLLQSIRD